MKKVSDINLKKGMTANELVEQMHKSGGFTAKKLAAGVNILEKMVKDPDCKIFLSFPACIISTGTRGIIRDLIKTTFRKVDHHSELGGLQPPNAQISACCKLI